MSKIQEVTAKKEYLCGICGKKIRKGQKCISISDSARVPKNSYLGRVSISIQRIYLNPHFHKRCWGKE